MSIRDLLDLDPEQPVVNPARKKLDKKIGNSTAWQGMMVKKVARAKGAEAEKLKAEIDE